jgi:hypothetical protein
MFWGKKATPVHDKTRAVGLDLTASRIRAVALSDWKTRALVLDAPAEDLQLVIALDRRSPEVGRAGVSICRKTPHAVCSNFLPCLAQGRDWRFGRHALTPDAALELALAKIRGPVIAESESVVVALPAYLGPAQVGRVVTATAKVKLPIKGTTVGTLALVADRAAALLSGKPVAPELPPPDWVVPLHPAATGPGAVTVIDADEYALSAAVVSVERTQVRLAGSATWPRLAVKAWKDRLLDAISDRCIRLCRRDPRDSPEAEQGLFEQLDDALDRARAGQRVSLAVRTDRWFQDVVQQPDEFDASCATLARTTAEAVREFSAGIGLPVAPRAVWLTHEAGRLPGLARSIHMHNPEGTAVEVLPPTAVAQAAAALVPRWLTGGLPRVHLDTVLELPPVLHEPGADRAHKGRR